MDFENKEKIKILDIDDEDRQSDKSNSEDVYRQEMKWESRQEEYFKKILKECLEFQKQHDRASHYNKKKYIFMSIPIIILPLVLSSINDVLVEKYNYVNTTGMMISGIISGLSTFFNFSKKQAQHNEFSGKYDELAGEIEAMLSKPKRHRIACDVAIERIKNRYNHLNNSAPML